jgi:diguanylate cyclase (GGDEF)-like protein
MKLSVQNKAAVLLGVVIVLVFVLGVFALAELHIGDGAINQAAADALTLTGGAALRVHSLASASHSRLQLSYVVIVVLTLAIVSGAIAAVALLEGRRSGVTETPGSAARTISSGEIAEPTGLLGGADHEKEADQLRLIRELTKENERLLAKDRERATIDAVTGLPNRMALTRDLEASLTHVDECPEMTLALLDLDGFKPYNDAFSHAAGDALLVRLAERLRRALDGSSSCYRMDGDEFCVLVTAGEKAGNAVARRAAKALSEQGEAFSVSCSFGVAALPREAASASDALRLADRRMYEQKMAHGSVRRESTTVLLKMLGERSPDLIERAKLAEATAQELGLADTEIARIGLAAKLRDVGKSAIPDMILNKPGPLDDEEWVFMRRHTQIGARIISAAPSLVGAAELVRSHHEWFNGRGYPDFLAGDAIPIGAQIIAVCDAFGAMRSHRAYRSALNEQEALDELTRCAGTQFSPLVVRTFVKLMGQRSRPQEPRRLRALG